MRFATHISLGGIVVLLTLSFSFGFHNYTETRKAIVSDLNRALQATLLTHSDEWMNPDTLRTYTHLSTMLGNPVSIESHNQDFADALRFASLKEKSGILIRILNKEEKTAFSSGPLAGKEKAESYLASDTVLWIAADLPAAYPQKMKIGVSFQGYVNGSFGTVFELMNKSLPGLFFCLSLLLSSCHAYLFYSGKFSRWKPEVLSASDTRTIAYGNMSLSCDTSCFYKEDREKLKMTPQQYTVMEMFFRSPTHILTRTEICETLWPGKINADETLNTLIRRLRPLVEENSNLKITTDRGRAYILEVVEENKG